MIPLILGILLGIVCALYDKGKRFVDHTPRFLFRVGIALILARIGVTDILDWIINVISIGVGFYLVFDYVLNFLEKRKWNYIGNTALLDKLINKYFNWKYLLITKILLVIIVCILNKL